MSNDRRRPTPAAPLLAAVLAASIAIGCGGSGGGSNDCGKAGGSASGPGRLTRIGTTLKIGRPGIVKYESLTRRVKSTLEVIPKTLEKGSIDDFDGVSLEPSQKSTTPYYVKVCVNNVGSGDLSKTDDPTGGNLTGVDERDESLSSVTFIGDFNRCKSSVDAPASLQPGESFGTCLVFLVPKGGGSLAKLKWRAVEVIWTP